MIKVRKIDFGGYCMRISALNTGLNAAVLERDYLAEQSDFYPEESNIFYKIIAIQDDFSIKEIVSERDTILEVCACNDKTVIYQGYINMGNNYKVYTSTSSKKQYISKENYSTYRLYDDFFVITEKDGYSATKKIIAFDMDLNIIKSTVIGDGEINEYELAMKNSMADYELYVQELRNKHSDIYINTTSENYEEAKKYNSDPNYTLVVQCYERETKKWYLAKFNKIGEMLWKTEISENVVSDIVHFKDCYYVLDFANRGYKHWLMKYSENGELLDTYEFKAPDGIMMVYNDKLVIVYDDISSLKPWQRKAYKDVNEGYLCPTSMLVIEEWD